MDDEDDDEEYNILENEGGDKHNDSKSNSRRPKKEEKVPFNALVSTRRLYLGLFNSISLNNVFNSNTKWELISEKGHLCI